MSDTVSAAVLNLVEGTDPDTRSPNSNTASACGRERWKW